MIDLVLLLLKNELTSFLADIDPASVVIDNIGLLETPTGSTLSENIVITLVNIEEESTLKNQPALRRPFNGSATYENPPVYLNLYILFTCNYSGDRYQLALRRLSHVIRFVQGRTSFSSASSVTGGSLDFTRLGIAELKFTLELYTLTFEQINHLWGSLGGRQAPFAMYKMRLTVISNYATIRTVPVIEEINKTLTPVT
ncbi:MAG: DUF4255 domain-containing protein [Chitinophagaceae bacterium]|nr:MAG: DUF4255 domain-containing protein [Chitinophagaceae bacterium]